MVMLLPMRQAEHLLTPMFGQMGGIPQTITGLSPGAYSVTVTDLSGCSRTASGTVGNVSGPSVTITGAIPICAGQTVTLTANGTGGTAPLGYSWSP